MKDKEKSRIKQQLFNYKETFGGNSTEDRVFITGEDLFDHVSKRVRAKLINND